ncbi:MAG: hypothetical protein M3020_02040 [Myxococcota bacterium]|nr:hypothetical protein [Myxococcota bacterium]
MTTLEQGSGRGAVRARAAHATAFVLAALCAAAGCRHNEPSATPKSEAPVPKAEGPAPSDPAVLPAVCPSPAKASVSVALNQKRATLERLFPVRSALPLPYAAPGTKSRVPETLEDSLRTFLTASLKRDQFSSIDVQVEVRPDGAKLAITAEGCHLEDYATQLPRFVEAGVLGLAGWDACVAKQPSGADGSGCAPYVKQHRCASSSQQCAPWEFMLPLGLPLVNHWSVLLLDYPPSAALCGADYLNNFTMQRWAQVFAWQGTNADTFEALVDVHPIAADGSGESSAIAKNGVFFRDYVKAILQVLLTPPNLERRGGVDYGGRSLPVLASGGPARQALGDMLGQSGSVPVGKTGETSLLVAGKKTLWGAANHPVFTTYNCCPGDPACRADSHELVASERGDFEQICYARLAAAAPGSALANRGACDTWVATMAEPLCVQARLDYSFDSDGNCHCRAGAERFCSAHANNACSSAPDGSYLSCTEADGQAGCPAKPSHDWFRCAALE